MEEEKIEETLATEGEEIKETPKPKKKKTAQKKVTTRNIETGKKVGDKFEIGDKVRCTKSMWNKDKGFFAQGSDVIGEVVEFDEEAEYYVGVSILSTNKADWWGKDDNLIKIQ